MKMDFVVYGDGQRPIICRFAIEDLDLGDLTTRVNKNDSFRGAVPDGLWEISGFGVANEIDPEAIEAIRVLKELQVRWSSKDFGPTAIEVLVLFAFNAGVKYERGMSRRR